jgi:hypothetical protein
MMSLKKIKVDYDDIGDVLYVYEKRDKGTPKRFTTEIWRSSLIALRRDRSTREPIGFIIVDFESFYKDGKFTPKFFPKPFQGAVYKAIIDKVKEELSPNTVEQ